MKVVLDEGAFAPTKAHESDAGWDLYSREDVVIPGLCEPKNFEHQNGIYTRCLIPNEAPYVVLDTGVHVELPPNTCGQLWSKSGLNVKHNIVSTGLIDVGYTGSIKVKLYNLGSEPYEIHKGDKITQLVIVPIINETIEVVDSLAETERGDNGFGSSGK